MFIIARHCEWLNRTPFFINSLKSCQEFFEIVVPFILLQLENKITCHKARVTSTLDRLAQQVALEKKERANKCRAFKVRLHQYQTIAFKFPYKHSHLSIATLTMAKKVDTTS